MPSRLQQPPATTLGIQQTARNASPRCGRTLFSGSLLILPVRLSSPSLCIPPPSYRLLQSHPCPLRLPPSILLTPASRWPFALSFIPPSRYPTSPRALVRPACDRGLLIAQVRSPYLRSFPPPVSGSCVSLSFHRWFCTALTTPPWPLRLCSHCTSLPSLSRLFFGLGPNPPSPCHIWNTRSPFTVVVTALPTPCPISSPGRVRAATSAKIASSPLNSDGSRISRSRMYPLVSLPGHTALTTAKF